MKTTEIQIKNPVNKINKDYIFADENTTFKVEAELGINGWQIGLADVNGGGWHVVFTQHEVVTASVCSLILRMLYWDILERQAMGHYSVKRGV
jgi:hypothetical protein